MSDNASVQPGAGIMPPEIDGTPNETPTNGDQPISEEMSLFMERARLMFPDMPADFISAFAGSWVGYADLSNGSQLALAELRTDPRYETWFPGNLREDGTAHIDEGTYWTQRTSYEAAIEGIGIQPGIFTDEQYVSLISGDVGLPEFRARVRTQANEVLARSDAFKAYYAEIHGFEPTDSAIMASAFSGNSDALLQDAGIASVGFEGERRDFDVSMQMAASLYDAGVQTQAGAAEVFGQAATDVPLFGMLAQRHFDSDDNFDLGDALDAIVFDDQEQIRRIQRMTGQERTLFSRSMQARRNGDAVIGLLRD